VCLRVLAVLFLPSSRLRELFDSRAETLLGAAQRVFTMGARGVPPFPSPVPEGFHPPDQKISIRGHESAARTGRHSFQSGQCTGADSTLNKGATGLPLRASAVAGH